MKIWRLGCAVLCALALFAVGAEPREKKLTYADILGELEAMTRTERILMRRDNQGQGKALEAFFQAQARVGIGNDMPGYGGCFIDSYGNLIFQIVDGYDELRQALENAIDEDLPVWYNTCSFSTQELYAVAEAAVASAGLNTPVNITLNIEDKSIILSLVGLIETEANVEALTAAAQEYPFPILIETTETVLARWQNR